MRLASLPAAAETRTHPRLRFEFLTAAIPREIFAREFRKFFAARKLDLCLWIVSDLRDIQLCRKPVDGVPILAVGVACGQVTVGPLYIAGSAACPACLQYWAATAGFERASQPEPASKAEVRIAARRAAEMAVEFLDGRLAAALLDGLFRFNSTSTPSYHPVFRRLDCPTCSPGEPSADMNMRVHCSPLTGIIRRLDLTTAPVAGAFRGIATWLCPLPAPGARPLLKEQTSYGNGPSRQRAEQACLGEALERYSLIYRGNEPLVRARLADLPAIDPRTILLYSDRQYAGREKWNRDMPDHYFVGEPFDPERLIAWMPARDLTDGHAVFAPAASTLMWYQPFAGESEYARADTVGCGSGRTFEDALAHALLEWVERDAMAIWWYNRIRRPAVSVESFQSEALNKVSSGIARTGRKLVLLDATSDLGIPVYISVSVGGDGTAPLFAGASHPSPRIAALKAATEVGQIWSAIVHRQGTGPEMHAWISKATLENQSYLAPTEEVEAPPEPAKMSSAAQVELLVDRLKRAGLRPVSVDLSRPDVLLKTARAIVPGLRHIWNRRAPGRLYDVPVRLGWRKTPLAEDELNSICCMI